MGSNLVTGAGSTGSGGNVPRSGVGTGGSGGGVPLPPTGLGEGGGQPSNHPTDILMRDIIQQDRTPTPDELRQIRAHIATASFNPAMRRVGRSERGKSYQGIVLGARALSTDYHLVKRVVIEQQWAYGTTFAEYLADLRNIVRSGQSSIALYFYRNEHTVMAIAPRESVVAATRTGSRPEQNILVIYSADRGNIITGYQFSELSEVDLPEGVRWHK